MTTAAPPLAPSHRTTITHSVLLRRHRRGLSLCTGSCHCSSTSPTRLTSPDLVKHCASPLSSEFRALSLGGGENGVSTSSAMATEAQVSTQDDKLKDAQMEAADKPEKVGWWY